MQEQAVTDIPAAIGAITLFVEDLAAARAFYEAVFGLPVHHEDEASAVFRFGPTLVNLLDAREAPELVAPAAVGSPAAGVRFQLTVEVADVDEAAAELQRRGATLLNSPIDRPWGVRTATFRDPAGHIWEVASRVA
jgi:catechol 2,3-dioxygenase-like lactoylglutathione lyase family enzyme